MNTEITTQSQSTGLSVFDSGQFDQMGLIASKLADSPILPETLRGIRKGQTFTLFEPAQIASNCFRLVEQASRWGMSPFGIMDGASVIHGKLMWEGKIVSAAIASLTGVRLNYEYSGDGINRKVIASGTLQGEDKERTVEGTVKDWKTDQWKSSAFDQRLSYRAAREWARRHTPEVIYGVYSPDEFDGDEMRDVNDSSRVIVRDQPINPATPGLENEEAPKGAPKGDANPEKKAPEGKQTKERHLRDGILKDVTPRESKQGKAFFCAVFTIPAKSGDKNIEFFTFSESLNERLLGRVGDELRITFTESPKGGFQLEDFAEVEGSLI